MRRLTAWVGGVIGGVAAYRWLRRRPEAAAEPPQEQPDERAEELRAKLAESREPNEPSVAEPDEPTPAEPDAPESPESPEDRRRRVHEEGRSTLDEMKPDGAEG